MDQSPPKYATGIARKPPFLLCTFYLNCLYTTPNREKIGNYNSYQIYFILFYLFIKFNFFIKFKLIFKLIFINFHFISYSFKIIVDIPFLNILNFYIKFEFILK